MKYSNDKVRRQDRLLDETEATELLRGGEYGVLSMNDGEGGAYGIPINYVWDGAGAIYLHCAPEGRKLRYIAGRAKVSFCVVGETEVVSDKFTTAYRSIILDCRACTGLPEKERMRALELLLDKYSPGDKAMGMKYAAGSFHRTEIVRLDIVEWSGKCKRKAGVAG